MVLLRDVGLLLTSRATGSPSTLEQPKVIGSRPISIDDVEPDPPGIPSLIPKQLEKLSLSFASPRELSWPLAIRLACVCVCVCVGSICWSFVTVVVFFKDPNFVFLGLAVGKPYLISDDICVG